MRSCLAPLDTPASLVEPSTDFDFDPGEDLDVEVSRAPPKAARRWATAAAVGVAVALPAAGIGLAVARRARRVRRRLSGG